MELFSFSALSKRAPVVWRLICVVTARSNWKKELLHGIRGGNGNNMTFIAPLQNENE